VSDDVTLVRENEAKCYLRLEEGEGVSLVWWESFDHLFDFAFDCDKGSVVAGAEVEAFRAILLFHCQPDVLRLSGCLGQLLSGDVRMQMLGDRLCFFDDV